MPLNYNNTVRKRYNGCAVLPGTDDPHPEHSKQSGIVTVLIIPAQIIRIVKKPEVFK
jgi:hypothetical protein